MLNGSETLEVRGVGANGQPSGETFQTTTQEIADLGNAGGGGSPTSRQVISSGATGSEALLGSINIFNSSDAANKFLPIPASTGSGKSIWIFDFAGTAYEYPITPQPVSGSITGTNQVYTNNGSIQLYDDPLGWLSI